MNMRNFALFITFLLGFFIIIGAFLAFFLKKKTKVLDFIFAFALSIISMLIFLDLLPEAFEHLGLRHLAYFLIFVFVGFLLFKGLDEFIPEHHDHKMTKKEEQKNVCHIGTLATIALIIHNIIEGMAIFIAASNDISLGIMMSLGVGLHNIPLGMIISSTFYQSGEKSRKFYILMACLFFSTFLGGLLPYCFHIYEVNNVIMGSLLSLTLGMLSYIVIFELWPRVKETKNKKITIYGLLLGILLLLCTLFFE